MIYATAQNLDFGKAEIFRRIKLPTLKFSIGETVQCAGKLYVIKHLVSFDAVIAQDLDSKKLVPLKTIDLVTPSKEEKQIESVIPANFISDAEKKLADLRFSIIEPLLYVKTTRDLVKDQGRKAVELQLLKKGNPSTIYDWIRKYLKRKKKTDLLPPKPTGGGHKSRLPDNVEELLQATIEAVYLTTDQNKPGAVIEAVKLAIKNENDRLSMSGE